MSSAFATHLGPPGVGPITLPVSPLTTAQYLGMVDAGILGPESNVELIGGQIIPMAPSNSEHNNTTIRFPRLFARVLEDFEISIQGTLVVAEGQVFDPDFMLLRRKPGGYRRELPRPDDALLVIEASAASLDCDRHVKLPVYAAVGIQEYWIADVDKMSLTVFREPAGSAYGSEALFAGDQTVASLACPDLAIRVADIFA